MAIVAVIYLNPKIVNFPNDKIKLMNIYIPQVIYKLSAVKTVFPMAVLDLTSGYK